MPAPGSPNGPNSLSEIDGFRAVDHLASGGSADVYAAIDAEGNRPVAIKILNQELASDEVYRTQFLTTTVRLSDLCTTSPNDLLVPVLGSGETEGRPYIVMPFAAGGTLLDRVDAADADLSKRRTTAVQVVSLLADGLSLLHDAGLVHRDVKPSNVLIFGTGASVERATANNGSTESGLLTSDEVLQLSDFGSLTSYRDLSYLGRLAAGTRGYAAPETRSANPDWSPQADVYSATMCVIAVLLGAPPSQNWAEQLRSSGHSRELVAELRTGSENSAEKRHASIEAWGNSVRQALVEPARFMPRRVMAASIIVVALMTALLGYRIFSGGPSGDVASPLGETAAPVSVVGGVDSNDELAPVDQGSLSVGETTATTSTTIPVPDWQADYRDIAWARYPSGAKTGNAIAVCQSLQANKVTADDLQTIRFRASRTDLDQWFASTGRPAATELDYAATLRLEVGLAYEYCGLPTQNGKPTENHWLVTYLAWRTIEWEQTDMTGVETACEEILDGTSPENENTEAAGTVAKTKIDDWFVEWDLGTPIDIDYRVATDIELDLWNQACTRVVGNVPEWKLPYRQTLRNEITQFPNFNTSRICAIRDESELRTLTASISERIVNDVMDTLGQSPTKDIYTQAQDIYIDILADACAN